MTRTPNEQLVHFLSDMYSVEQQAIAQLISAPKIAGDPALAAEFRLHYTETEQQAELVRERLESAQWLAVGNKRCRHEARRKGLPAFCPPDAGNARPLGRPCLFLRGDGMGRIRDARALC